MNSIIILKKQTLLVIYLYFLSIPCSFINLTLLSGFSLAGKVSFFFSSQDVTAFSGPSAPRQT